MAIRNEFGVRVARIGCDPPALARFPLPFCSFQMSMADNSCGNNHHRCSHGHRQRRDRLVWVAPGMASIPAFLCGMYICVSVLHQRAGITSLAVDDQSRDTRENARESAKLLQSQGIRRVLLVTHAYHMPRSLLSARAAGIDAIPAPFAFEHVVPELQGPSELMDWLPQPGYLGRSYRILHEMAGLVWYGLNQR